MIESVTHRGLNQARGLGRHQAALVLSLELRVAQKHRDHGGAAAHHVFRGDIGRALRLIDTLGVIFEAAQ